MANQLLKLANGKPAPDPNKAPPPFRQYLYHKTEPERIFTSQADVDAAIKDGWQDRPFPAGNEAQGAGRKAQGEGEKDIRIRELETALSVSKEILDQAALGIEARDAELKKLKDELDAVKAGLESKEAQLAEAEAALDLAEAKIAETAETKGKGKK